MVFSYACLVLQRVLMPTILVLAALFRPVGISFVYLLMFFVSPFIPIATTRNFKGSVTAYLIILIALSTIVILCHIALQVTLIAIDVKSTFGMCSFTEQLLRHVGFIDFRGLKAIAIVEWLAPEVIVFITSLVVYLVTKRLTVQSVPGQLENGEADPALQIEHLSSSRPNSGGLVAANAAAAADKPNFDKLIQISPLFCLATLFFAAVLRPSVPGGFYFLIFLLSGSYWATFQKLQRGFALLLRCVMAVLVLQTVSIVAYQTPYMQAYLKSDTLAARLIGLEPLITSSCEKDIRIIVYNTDYKADSFISPFVLFFAFYALALTTKNLIKPRIIEKLPPVNLFGLQQQPLQPSQSQQQQQQQQLSQQQQAQSQLQQQSQQQLENGNNKLNRQLSLMAQTSRGSSKKDSWSKTQQRLNVSLRREHRPMITEPNETTPLVRHSARKSRTSSRTESITGHNVTTTLGSTNNDNIPLENRSLNRSISNRSLNRSEGDDEVNASLFDQICYGIVSVGGFIYQNSYIFTNILMMAWSIVYHSWLTFALLLWANVLWMIPNQRKAMMRSSPFIVIYAELLVIAQYIYGMDLTNDELPSTVKTTGINLSQIGLERPQENGMQPCVPLIVKTSFLLMFWVTLRQFFKEKSDKRHSSTVPEMIAPLNLSIGASSSNYRQQTDNKKTSKFLKKAGDIIKNLLVRLWIWLLVLVIFLCAITGKDMTGFRICYMALFLFFLLVFQSSSSAWVKVMYGFWLFLIFYAMSILILIYTYQFDKFDQYWNDYLNISKTLQTDIGLERYKTKDLFLHLVSPTIIVILTVIQVHYFHRRFIASLQPTPAADDVPPAAISDGQPPLEGLQSTPLRRQISASRFSVGSHSMVDAVDFEQSVRDLLRKSFKRLKSRAKRYLKQFKDIFWRFLELHIIKAVYITAFVCCVSEVCVLHIVFIILCIVGAISRQAVQIFISRMISFIVTIIILSKMIYQVAYLDHNRYNVVCNDSKEILNNAEWFGFKKATPDTGGLMGLLRNYIIYMVMVTLHAVVTLRQFQMRSQYGQSEKIAPKVLFPTITREDAEKNLRGMMKYIFNYGFYKFGMEITLITLVSTITYRQDIVAVAYAVWLFVLLCFDRAKCAKIWAVLQCFVATSIFLQYILLVALPPSICLRYPWLDSKYSEPIQRWALLPGDLHYVHVTKLIFDFLLLLVIHRQKRVFYIESRPGNYPGGSNRSVIKDIASLGQVHFENPTHDFISHVRNYLDVFKNGILSSFYWITLAVVFLAGTNIADLLALGYLIGAFVFLWQGSDFYLRPINVIVRRWNYLITYNVANILIKTCLQMAGCMFIEELTSNCCWFVHMFGISCASQPMSTSDIPAGPPLNDECPQTTTHIALLWDAVCFAFLLLQMRIFKSHYFCHIIVDTKANSILASRGADIIEDLRRKQIEHRQDHEKEVLLKIKRKMEKIRATQQKMLKPIDKPTHFDEKDPTAHAGTVKMAPLAHNSSFSSCHAGSGYQTPDDDDDNDSDTQDECTTRTQNSTSTSDNDGNSTDSDHNQLIDDKEATTNLYGDLSIQIDCDEVNEDGDQPQRRRLVLPEFDIRASTQQNTPSSDMMTIPLEGFLEANRLSMGSAPASDIIVRLQTDSESSSSYEVFAPPMERDDDDMKKSPRPSLRMHTLLPPIIGNPSNSCSLNVNVSGGSSVISSNLATSISNGRHRRQSSVNAVSWNDTVSIKCASKDSTASAEVSEDIPVTLRQKSLHRRHFSMGNAAYSMDEQSTLQNGRRRYSNVSWARTATHVRTAVRPNSWGPVGTAYYLESLMFEMPESTLHAQSVRAGDYYMFEDVDDKFELDLIEDEVDFLEDEDKITQSEKKINRRKTLIDVWKDIQSSDNRRKLYVRQRSYASAPGSRIGIKIDDELDVCCQAGGEASGVKGAAGGLGVRASTYSEPLEYAVSRSNSEYLMEQTKAFDQRDFSVPSTSKEATSEEPSEKKPKPDIASADLTEKESDDDIEANPIVRLLEGFLVSLTMRLNRFSRNYRYVNKTLALEKKALKESNALHRIGRTGTAAMFSVFKKNIESDETENGLNNTNTTPQHTPTPHTKNNTNNTTTNNVPPSQAQSQSQDVHESQQQPQDPHVVDIIETPSDTVDARDSRQEPGSSNTLARGRRPDSTGLPEIRIKAPSCERSNDGSGSLSKQCSYDKVDSASELPNFEEEDFTTRDHHIIIEVLIAAWYAFLSNTDLICYIVVFIYQVVNASIISLPLPIMVFLWGTLSLPRPTKTFWVTLIAYTQAVVLIKCVFQFKLIWANYINLPNQPLALAKIFGVELDPNYASYDLLLLLVLFFHRFILKSQGLWKSEYNEAMQIQSQSGSKLTIGGTSDQEVPESSSALVATQSQQQSTDTDGNFNNGEEHNYNDLLKERLERSSYFASLCKFFTNMVNKSRLPADVYALMFLCDFINFFVLLFGFTAFGSQQAEGDGGVQTYLAENKVPIPFLIMLLVQFILIVIDRALYLRKALVYKIIFHFLSVVGIHIWMFFVVPAVTERSFYSLAPPIIFYIIKCFYMLLSSYQIKCGYPKRILGNFLTKGFSMANMIAFKVYMQMPFLYELRTILDWVCTDTTMTLFDWLKMEDIFSDIFFIKCSRQLETDFPAIRAQKKALFSKLLMGGTVILLIVVSIWGPLCLFALGNAVGQPNVPYEVSVSIRIGPYDPIYSTNNRESIFTFDEKMFGDMQSTYIKDKSAFTFLSNYDAEDVAAVKLASNSPSMWGISPPDKERLLSDLINNVTLVARFTYTLTRVPPAKGLTGSVGDEVTFDMNSTFPGRPNMINMLNGTGGNNETVVLPDLLPKFIKVLNLGDTGLVHQLMPSNEKYRPLVIKFNYDNNTNDMWWEIRDYCNDSFYNTTLSKLPFINCDGGIVMYTFNDKKFPSTFSFLTAGGIIGLYTTFVLLASRFLKSFIAGQNRKIMFEDLPYVDRVLQLCLDIYLVREALEFALEEDLFAKLIFLYRSPETMIKWTRPKEEIAEDETDTESVRSRNSGRRPEHQ